MTKKELQKYIAKATKEVNRGIKKRTTGNKQLDKSVKFLQKASGVKRGNKIGDMKSNVKKDELLKQARLFQAHFAIDKYSKNGVEFNKKRLKQNMKSLTRNRGIKLNEKNYKDIITAFQAVSMELMEQLDSTQIVAMLKEAYKKNKSLDMQTVADIIIYESMKEENKGLTQSNLRKKIYDRLIRK